MDHNQHQTHIFNSTIKLRTNPMKRRDKIYVGCGAGFAGDRPSAALKLLQRVKYLNYVVLECLAERTLADRYHAIVSGADGYDPRISDWIRLLLPLAVAGGTCIITNMGAMDPLGAQNRVIELAKSMGFDISVAVAHESNFDLSGSGSTFEKSYMMKGGVSTYLGAAPIVECLEKYQPNVIITSRVADAALFLAPMVYELGWNWDDLEVLAQGALAGHLLECGCHLTGGYFMHPGDKYRDIPFTSLLDLSLPYAEISSDGKVCIAKAEASGGILNFSTCAEQLLYEVGDPCAYITPDVVIDFDNVSFTSLSNSKVLCAGARPAIMSVPDKLLRLIPKDHGWKGWGEISYGGYGCVKRAKAAEYLVRSWMEEVCPGVDCNIVAYIIGLDSLKASKIDDVTSSEDTCKDIRLRMDGLFEQKEQAVQFIREFMALYTNGPAGGGGISTGYKKEIILEKQLIEREQVFWRTGLKRTEGRSSSKEEMAPKDTVESFVVPESVVCTECSSPVTETLPAPSGQKIPMYRVAHSRAGDKGNDLNFSIIPHFAPDIERLKLIITPEWVKDVLSSLLNASSFPDPDTIADTIAKRDEWLSEHVKVEIYEVKGISSLNVVVRNILDGGVNCSRRIDRHGKTISDLILCQQVVLPP